MNLGSNIRKFRQEKKLKQEDLANKLGKSTSVVSNWEKGINRPDADTIGQICKILSITPNELFEWNKIGTPETKSALQIFERYEKLDDNHKKFLEKQIIQLLELQNNKN